MAFTDLVNEVLEKLAETDKSQNDEMLEDNKKKFGVIMTTDFDADQFLKVLRNGENGGTYLIFENLPPMAYPDLSNIYLPFVVIGGATCQKLFGTEIFQRKHQLLILLTICLIILLVIFALSAIF